MKRECSWNRPAPWVLGGAECRKHWSQFWPLLPSGQVQHSISKKRRYLTKKDWCVAYPPKVAACTFAVALCPSLVWLPRLFGSSSLQRNGAGDGTPHTCQLHAECCCCYWSRPPSSSLCEGGRERTLMNAACAFAGFSWSDLPWLVRSYCKSVDCVAISICSGIGSSLQLNPVFLLPPSVPQELPKTCCSTMPCPRCRSDTPL